MTAAAPDQITVTIKLSASQMRAATLMAEEYKALGSTRAATPEDVVTLGVAFGLINMKRVLEKTKERLRDADLPTTI